MFTRLAHVAFQVRDLEASLAFYRDGLGMPEHFRITYGQLLAQMADDAADGRPHDVDARTTAAFEVHRDDPWLVYVEIAPLQFLELFPGIVPQAVPEKLVVDVYSHFCLEVADLDELRDDLEARGLEPEPTSTGLDGSRQFWLTDPDGHRLEVMQYTAGSLQLTARS